MYRRTALVFALSSLALLSNSTRSLAQESKKPATTDSQVAAVQAADDARTAAMKMPQREKLDAIFSDDLRYAHSTGSIDTKSSFIDALTAGKTKYLGFDYEQRDFTFPAPGVSLMTGRVRVRVSSGDSLMDNTLSYLAVWGLENGHWRFLAWQSCKMPVVSAK